MLAWNGPTSSNKWSCFTSKNHLCMLSMRTFTIWFWWHISLPICISVSWMFNSCYCGKTRPAVAYSPWSKSVPSSKGSRIIKSSQRILRSSAISFVLFEAFNLSSIPGSIWRTSSSLWSNLNYEFQRVWFSWSNWRPVLLKTVSVSMVLLRTDATRLLPLVITLEAVVPWTNKGIWKVNSILLHAFCSFQDLAVLEQKSTSDCRLLIWQLGWGGLGRHYVTTTLSATFHIRIVGFLKSW